MFTVLVPPNTEAEVVLPDGHTTVVGPGLATFDTDSAEHAGSSRLSSR
jgi:hypothetical protein